MKSHIGPNGPARCNATSGVCPYGGESGQENHFSTLKEARDEYDRCMSEAHGAVVTLKAAKVKLSEREKELRAANAAMAKEILELRASRGEGLVFEDANPERAQRRLHEAVDFAESRGNTHLAAKLSSSSVLPSGAFKTADGARVNTDQVLAQKTILNHVENERNRMLGLMGQFVRSQDVAVGTKWAHKDENGSYSFSVTTGVDEDALAALPDKVTNAISSPKSSYSIDRAREVLSPERLAEVTKQTLVTDFIMGKAKEKDLGLPTIGAPKAGTTQERLDDCAAQVAAFYGKVKADHGGVKASKVALAEGQEAIKAATAARGQNTFSPARSQSNGILVSGREMLDMAAVNAKLSPEERASIQETTMAVDPEKAKAVLSPEEFGRIFQAKKVSMRVTEK